MGTSIPCQEATRDRLKDIRDGDFRSWDEFLNELADAYEVTSEEMPSGLAEVETATPAEIQDLKDDLRKEIDKLPERTADELEVRLR